MAKATIDVQGMSRIVTGIQNGIETLDSARTSLRTTLAHYYLDTSRTAALQGPADWARDELPSLRRRLALAEALEGSNPSWPTGKVELDDVTDITSMDPDKAEQAGREAAETLKKGDKPDDELIAQIAELQNDPYFAAGFAGALDADELADVVIRLGYQRTKQDGQHTQDEIDAQNEWYASLLNGMSTTVATATRNTGDLALPSDYAQGWMDTIKAEVPTSPSYDGGDGQVDRANALTVLLNTGRYGDEFLGDIAEQMYDYEREVGDERGKVWGPKGSDLSNQYGGVYDADGVRFTDPMTGLMSALSHNPGAAADFFNPDGGGAQATDRAKYLIQDRTWSADDFDSIGAALDAAGTTYHSADASLYQQEQSAWIASATVYYLGSRDDGWHDKRIGDSAKDSLGHLLSSYVADIDSVAAGTDGDGPGTYEDHPAPWQTGFPVGAEFDVDTLKIVLREVMTDTGAASQLGAATAALNADRMNWAAKDWGGEGNDYASLSAAAQGSAALQGFILQSMGVGLSDEAAEADEQAQAYIDFASDVVGLIPTGGTFTSFLVDQAKGAGEDWLSDEFTGNESRVKNEQHSVQEVAWTDQQIAMAQALGEAGKLPKEAMTDPSGAPYPWFESGTFDAEKLSNPDVRNEFIRWLKSGELGQTPTVLIPQMSSSFSDGVRKASDG
ncbi:hypothetical protein IC607_07100 [Cellulomonas sp. JH27-2]|uniref:DUF6571 family protein n=1 Tax=Cellulomonas sp. JH27-2 TaxID=2774139 RepID=UPI0017852777|nr:DUF6571 family protein [Cellulomonas sp. JH27-2]MBD8058730.1 hypothetical protein [Cellulomonas sp. JH27-2]